MKNFFRYLLMINLALLLMLTSLCWGNQDYTAALLNTCMKSISESSDPITDLTKCEKVVKSAIQRRDKAAGLLYLGRMHLQLPNALMYRFASALGNQYSEGQKKFNSLSKATGSKLHYTLHSYKGLGGQSYIIHFTQGQPWGQT
jgi:hypothetical protein